MADANTFAVAVTQAEWRSLLAMGELRLARRRVQTLDEPPTTKQRDRLFAWAPTTVLGDGNDTIVLELAEKWLTSASRHSSHPAEIVNISLEDVRSHHSVSNDSFEYFRGDAEKEGVELQLGRYDSLWTDWTTRETAALEISAARKLLATCDLGTDITKRRPDGYAWSDVISLARNSRALVKAKPKHVETLLQSVRDISDSIAGVRSLAALPLAANIEWINSRLGIDPLEDAGLKPLLETALEAGRLADWSSDDTACAPVTNALTQVHGQYPRAYTEEVNPTLVTFLIRLVMDSKEQNLSPIEFVVAIHRLVAIGCVESARLLCVSVSGALGAKVSRRLSRELLKLNPTSLDWS